jgi:hypothetical protein
VPDAEIGKISSFRSGTNSKKFVTTNIEAEAV